jgi:hypothetical protein
MNFDQLREITSEFEKILESALEQKYLQYQPEIRDHLLEFNPIRRWHLDRFLNTYISAGAYPAERLERLIYKLFDIKLQLYYILEVDLGLYNRLVYDRGYDKDNSLALPHVFLTRLSLDQSLIAKSRILWERIMNFVFYLENGDELEERVSGRRSKRKVFFEFTRGNLRWRFLEPYESVLQEYEDSYRTPEFHKGSVLRAELLGKRVIDPNKLLDLVNRSMNIVWENTISIVSGGKAQHFTDLHMSAEHTIDPRYLE